MDGIIVFLNGERGRAVIDALLAARHEVRATVIPAEMTQGSLRSWLDARGLRVIAATRVNDAAFLGQLHALSPRLAVIAGYPEIFRRPLFELPQLGTVNLHGGRLPQYRGGSPLNWQMINGEVHAGVSVIRVTEGIDSGSLLASGEIPIAPDDTIAEVHAKSHVVFARITLEVVTALESGTLAERAQDENMARYWHQRSTEDGRVRWDLMTAQKANDLVRAVTRPYPGAFCYRDGRRITIWRTRVPEESIHGVPGRVCYVSGRGPYVICTDRAVLLSEFNAADAEPLVLKNGDRLE